MLVNFHILQAPSCDLQGAQDDTTMEHKEFERDLQGGHDDTTSEHKEFDKDDVLKSDVCIYIN